MDGLGGTDRRHLPGLSPVSDQGGMRSVDDHRRIVAELISARTPHRCRLAEALGLVLAGDLVAPLSLPVFDRKQQERAMSNGRLAVAEGQLQQVRARAETEQTTASQRVSEANTAAERVQADIEEARAALASIEAGVLAGQIDLSTAVLLQTQVLDGEAAVVRLRGLLADARIDQLLANDDDALLGGAP